MQHPLRLTALLLAGVASLAQAQRTSRPGRASPYTSVCQGDSTSHFPANTRLTDGDIQSLFTYLPQELRDRPNYILKRSRDLAARVTCVAIAGRTVGQPWHDRMLLVQSEDLGLAAVLFEDQNAPEIALWQMVARCQPEGGMNVVIKGEWAGLAPVVYRRETWENGNFMADHEGPVRPVIRKARILWLYNGEEGADQTPEEWDTWLRRHSARAAQLSACARDSVQGYRDRVATRAARRRATEAMIQQTDQEVERLSQRLRDALVLCDQSRRCSPATREDIRQLVLTMRSCTVMADAQPGCAVMFQRANTLLEMAAVERARRGAWEAVRDSLRGTLPAPGRR